METDDPDSYGISWKAWPRDIWAGLQYLLTRTGPLASNVFESVAFLKTDPSLSKPDVQFVFQPARRAHQSEDPVSRSAMAMRSARSRSIPGSRGTLRLASSDPAAAPLIDRACSPRKATSIRWSAR